MKRGGNSSPFLNGIIMNVMGGGLIIVIVYATSGGLAVQNALLTEASDDILAESSDYIQVES